MQEFLDDRVVLGRFSRKGAWLAGKYAAAVASAAGVDSGG